MIIALPDILKLQSKHVTQPHLCFLNYAVSQPLPLTSPLPSQRPPQFPEHVTSSRAVTVPLIWLSRLDRPLRPPGPLASKSPHYVTERWLMFLSKGFCTVMVLIKYARCSFTLCIWNKSSHPAYTFYKKKTAFSEIVWAGRRDTGRASDIFSPWPLLWIKDEVCHGSFNGKQRDARWQMWKGRQDVSIYACVTAYAHSVCLCDSALMCTHMRAYAHAINKPPSVPPTQLDCDGMSRYNPHCLEKSLSLTRTQSYTHAHTCPLYKTLLNHILSFLLFHSLTAVIVS